MATPAEIRLTLNPSRRFEAIDVNARVSAEAGDLLQRYSRTLYCSLHTTAGYLDQSLAGRMHHHHGRLAQFFDAWHALFPPDADYHHDQMQLRSELTDEQKETIGKIAPDLVALNRATIKKVREMLTPEQIKTLEEKMPKGGKKGAKKSET